MATLSLTNTFIAGTLAKASEVNQNFTDLVNWSSGNIQNDNIGLLNGTISWAVTTGVKAISIANSGNEGSIGITQSVALNPNKATLHIVDNAAQTSGTAEVYVSMTSISSTIPVLRLDYGGSQVFAVKKDRLEFPVRTTAEREAIPSPANGSILYNSTTRNIDTYNTNGWSGIGVPIGMVIDFAGPTPPTSYFECDGAAISRTTYATLFTAIGTTWGVGDGSTTFNLPDLRRRTTIGRGGSQIAGPSTTLGSTGGHEQLQSHNHGFSTGGAGGHGHGISDPGHTHYILIAGGGDSGNVIQATSAIAGNGVAYFTSPNPQTTGISVNAVGDHSHSGTVNSNGSGNAENMQPSAVMIKVIKAF